ncbi:MAG TPA: SDR family oxidoreductase [Caldithrix sp.]|nr:SDR family oxidoreductase [Bacteroidales bacterium]MBN2763889.1 SDR family oxidoreductase [Bacteroidales bacterium]HEM49539.1 SDR family oxidoreductase [Caldithrix sp.]
MKVLFIGGTGFISSAVSRLAVERGFDLYLLNRGMRTAEVPGSKRLTADIQQPADVKKVIDGLRFDVVVDWIAFKEEDIERDLEFFRGKTGHYIFISSASAYQKPPAHYIIKESTPLVNPFWEYSRDKIACEERLMKAYHDEGFPATVIRPSLTYSTNFPIAIGGWGCYTLADRIMKGKPIIVHGDGTSLWVVTHAEDLAKGLLGLFGNAKAIGQAFHITTDEVLTWNQLYQTIAEALGEEANIVHIPSDFIAEVVPRLKGTLLGDKCWSVVFDNSKIKSFVPDFQATIPFRDGIRRTVEWFAADEKRRRVDERINEEMDLIIDEYRDKGQGTSSDK